MNLALAPYLLTICLSVSACWFLAFYTWRRRHTKAAFAFGALMLFAGLWAAFYGLELITLSLEGKLLWFNIKRLFSSLLGPCLVIFALEYSKRRIRYPRLLYAALLIEPFIAQIIYWTNAQLGWAGTPSLATDVVAFPLLIFDYSPWFWISIFIGYLLFAISTMILLAQLPGANTVYRKQLILILSGILLPWLAGVLSLLGLWHLELFDVTPLVFPVSGVLIVWGLLRYHFLGLMPVVYSAVFSSIRDGILILDDDFHIAESNPAALRLLGYKESTLIGQPITQIFPEWDQSTLYGAPFDSTGTLELYYEAGGQYRYLEVHAGNIVNHSNLPTGHVLILYDVTDRKLAEKSQQLSEDRYRTIFESSTAATIILEEDMTISLANDRFASLSGYTRQEIEGKKKWTEFVHSDDLTQMQAYHQARRQANDNPANVPDEYEFRFLNCHGKILDAFVSVALIPDSKISIASLIDITDHKLAEQLLQQRAADLELAVRGEQERSAIILQSVNDAIAVSDLDARTVFVNHAFSQITGYSLEEILGRHATFILNGRIPKHIVDAIQKALLNQVVWEGELQFRRKDDTVYDAAVLIAPMRDGLGKLIGYVSSHRDVTEAKQLEKSRRRFITNISHELRTPVTNLKLYIDLLQRHYNTVRQDQYFATLHEQIARLESIIQNSVEIISLEDGQRGPLRQPIQGELLSENLQTRLRPLALKKNIALQFSPELANLPMIIGNPQQITQALYELIRNALNFTQQGGEVVITGTVQTHDDQKWLTLAVCDNGPGIVPSEQSRIFDRFYRGQQAATGHIPGTGLGLNIVSLIAQAHNGRLTLESRLDQGSTFTLWLPLN